LRISARYGGGRMRPMAPILFYHVAPEHTAAPGLPRPTDGPRGAPRAK
jgi:hypothetical protein